MSRHLRSRRSTKLDKVHGLPTKASDPTKAFSNHLKISDLSDMGASFLEKQDNNSSRKINFHVSLTKYLSSLLQEASLYVTTDDGQVKFWFAGTVF